MKMRREHFVPLSNQAVAILQEVQEISGRKEGYVFTAFHTVTRKHSKRRSQFCPEAIEKRLRQQHRSSVRYAFRQ
jgi:integrase